jgi:hypothetical protein
MSGLKSRLPSERVSRRNPEVAPAVAAAALLLLVGLQFTLPSGASLPDGPRPRAANAKIADPIRPAPAVYAAIMAHPIFAPDRAPPPAEAETSGNLNGYEVLGTAIRGSTAAAALLRNSAGQISRARIGAVVDGWKLVSIARQELIFDRNGERRSLTVNITAPARPGASTVMGKAGASSGSSSSSDDDDTDDDDDDD